MELQYIIVSLSFGFLLTIPVFCLGLYMGRYEEKARRIRDEQCQNCNIAFENLRKACEDDIRRVRERNYNKELVKNGYQPKEIVNNECLTPPIGGSSQQDE